MWKKTIILTIASFMGCAHYSYVPEVKGPGAKHAKAGVVYSIPPQNEILKMEMVSLGMGKPKDKAPNQPSVEMLQIRLFFKRTKDLSFCDRVYFMPNEMQVKFPDGTRLNPSVIHSGRQKADSKVEMKNAIKLSCQPNQAVELFYALPKKKDEAPKVQSFKLGWRIHYGAALVEQQVARFDRQDPNSQNTVDHGTFLNDDFYPYDATLPMLDPEWIGDDWYWLDPLAIGPDF
jgi:hypothetical protein